MFKHGDRVTLHDAYGKATDGILHAPDEEFTRFQRVPGSTEAVGQSVMVPQSLGGGYGVYTLILPGNRRFRSEGRIYHRVA